VKSCLNGPHELVIATMGHLRAFTRVGIAAVSGAVALQHLSTPAVAPARAHCRALATGAGATTANVRLASTIKTPHFPTTVLVHGLDSSKETWSGIVSDLTRLGFPAIALDLRGHGESPMGDPQDFGPETLARDIMASVSEIPLAQIVLVGHSMGGKVAIHVAERMKSEMPGVLQALVIEDMDVKLRPKAHPADEEMPAERVQQLREFAHEKGRWFSSWDAARLALLPWYENDVRRVESWKHTRVRQTSTGWWSDINPAAQRLARDTILSSSTTALAWDALKDAPFPIHLWVADASGSVCSWEGEGGINGMTTRVPLAQARLFRDAGHSIHNTARKEFLEALVDVIRSAAASK